MSRLFLSLAVVISAITFLSVLSNRWEHVTLLSVVSIAFILAHLVAEHVKR